MAHTSFRALAGTSISSPAVYSGMCDASAAAALNDHLFAVASDEDSVIRVYRRDQSGAPVQSINLTTFLDLDPKQPESDIEGAARVGDRIYWITSHGRNRNGRERASRQRFFATQIVTNAEGVHLKMAGGAYEHLLSDLIRNPKLKSLNLAAASKLEPKARGALNIEGLSATPEGGLLIGFRNPIPHGKAFLVPMLNPDQVVHGGAAKLGEPIFLDLGGRGIRDSIATPGETYPLERSKPGGNHHLSGQRLGRVSTAERRRAGADEAAAVQGSGRSESETVSQRLGRPIYRAALGVRIVARDVLLSSPGRRCNCCRGRRCRQNSVCPSGSGAPGDIPA